MDVLAVEGTYHSTAGSSALADGTDLSRQPVHVVVVDTVFVYDDDCGFCTWWAEFFAARTDMQIVGFTELDSPLRDRLPAEFRRCSHVVTGDRVYSCGASIEEALLRTGVGSVFRPLVTRLRRIGVYRRFREWAYRRGATNRDRLGRLLSRTPPARTGSEET